MARKVRWGHVHEIDYRTRVGSVAWKARHSRRLQHLSAWRFLHVQRAHKGVAREGHKRGYRPSSDMPVSQKLDASKTFEQRDA